MKILISVDLEGIATLADDADGTFFKPLRTPRHLSRRVWRIASGEVGAAVKGAFAGGAKEVYVEDNHGIEFDYDQIDDRAKFVIINSRMRRFPVLDKTFSALFLVGYHPMFNTPGGVLAHTYSRNWDVTLNGRPIGEIGGDAALAGSLGVPVALVTSSEKGIKEAREILGGVETVVTKKDIAYAAAVSLHPAHARKLIEEAAARSVSRLPEFKPLVFEPPYRVRVRFRDAPEELEGYLSRKPDISRRVDIDMVERVSHDIFEVLWR